MCQQCFTMPRMDGKNVLITGGLGFIGSNLAHRCLELGAQVTVFDCLDPNSGGNLYNVQDVKGRIELRLHDILNFDRLAECIMGKDILFNCAASTSHPFSMREPWLNLDANSRGVINLLEAARRYNKTIRFIHIGTTTQLGKLHYQPADESHPEFPTDIYSANKCASEKYALIYYSAHRIPVTVVRLPNVYGPRAAIHSSDFTFNNFFIGVALQGKEITIFGDGRQLRNVLYVGDAADALICAALHEETAGQTYFAVSDEHYSVGDVARATVEHLGSGSTRFVDWPKGRKAIDVGDAVISNAKFKDLTGWRPMVSLPEGLRRTKEYYAERLAHYL
ncbi:NAD(P)-dependent oxidoreductase [Geomonas oryzisoli]|uniref:NAD(P)-dependent oxidoreductase n=1 Tax=Geomonas oryzisoli TaxID=2847992 RepID=A0ABX8J5A5_9BACT|nr:NAD(P)-dependent oxidoreductase [Geomonas oryzisoli]QWV93640.1 NAD(P)-dependent oxidoreductase [Geomonas oryzisoli]